MLTSNFLNLVTNQYINRGYNLRDVLVKLEEAKDRITSVKGDVELVQERALLLVSMSNNELRETIVESVNRNTNMTEEYSIALENQFKYVTDLVESKGWSKDLVAGYDGVIESLREGRQIRSLDSHDYGLLYESYTSQINSLEASVMDIAMEATDEAQSFEDKDEQKQYEDELVESTYKSMHGFRILEGLRLKRDIAHFILTENSEEEEIEELVEIFNRVDHYDKLTEATSGWKQKAKNLALDAEKKSRKMTSKIVDSSKSTARVINAGSKAAKHFTGLMKDVANDLEEKTSNKRKGEIIQSKYHRKILKLIRYIVTNSAIFFVMGGGPAGFAVAALSTVVGLILESKWDDAVVDELIRDLEVELRITKEKIGEAESRGDNKAKYNLIRIEEAIMADIKRLKRGKKGIKGRSQTKRVKGSR